jgi:hypothetical protein
MVSHAAISPRLPPSPQIRRKMAEDPVWQKPNVIFSGERRSPSSLPAVPLFSPPISLRLHPNLP